MQVRRKRQAKVGGGRRGSCLVREVVRYQPSVHDSVHSLVGRKQGSGSQGQYFVAVLRDEPDREIGRGQGGRTYASATAGRHVGHPRRSALIHACPRDETTGVGRGGGLPQERGECRWLFVTRRMKNYLRRSYGAHQTSSSPPLQISCPSLVRGRRMEGPFLRPLMNLFPFLSFPLF